MKTQKIKTLFEQAEPPFVEIKTILEKSAKVLVASHIDPDGDALGTQLAFARYLKDMNKDVYLVRDGEIPDKYRFLEGINEIPSYDELENGLQFDTAVILECPNHDRVGRAACWLNDETTIINIDHHRDNDVYGVLNWINIQASSVGEMLYEYFERIDYDIDQHIAEQLYTAILTDTGRFRYKSTLPRTLEIAGELVAAGAQTQKICDLVYFNMNPSSMILIGKVLNGIEFYNNGSICILTLTKEMLAQSGASMSESDGLVDYTLFNRGVIVGALVKEIDEKLSKVSMRSKDGINVSQIAADFGGGGHFNASGCAIDLPYKEAKEKVVELFTEALSEK